MLVADDNPVNRAISAAVLEHAGHEVVTAEDGDRARDALGGVDVASLDADMPGQSGSDAASPLVHAAGRARLDPRVTADGTAGTAERCLAAGTTACFVGPLRPPALLDALDRALAAQGGTG